MTTLARLAVFASLLVLFGVVVVLSHRAYLHRRNVNRMRAELGVRSHRRTR